MLAVQILSAMLLGVVFAQLEIQIEGKRGWAADLPCWRKTRGWVVKLLGGRPLTGYHTWMTVFLILMFHFPFLFTDWYLRTELLIWGLLYIFFLTEDFAWFVFNPNFGIKKFRKSEVWWHGSWWGPVPSIYYFLVAMAVALIVLSQVL